VSSVASTRRADTSEASRPVRAFGREWSPDLLLGAGVAVLLVALAFLTGSGVVIGSGSNLGGNTFSEIVLTLLGAGAVVAVLLFGARGPAWGASAVMAFAAMVALTALSIAWSFQPDASWTATNQAIAFLAAFGIGLAMARLFPGRWTALIGAVAVLAVVVSAFALLGKVFLGLTGSDPTLGRLTAPLGYWNAVGLLAAMGLAPCLWLGAVRTHPRIARGLTVPAIAVLGATVMLSYSRSALAMAIICLALWFALSPTPLRAAAVLLPGLAGAAAISGWMLLHHALSDNIPPQSERLHRAAQVSAGHTFGVVLIVVLAACTAIGLMVVRSCDTRRLTDLERRRIERGLLGLLSLIPLGAVAALAGSSRGLTGEISHLWSTLTSTTDRVGTSASRITSLANSRPAYWHTALTIFSHHPLDGVGALGYSTARNFYTFNAVSTPNAHSFVFETLSDLGLIGLVVIVALFAAWLLACRRTLGPLLRRRARDSVTAEGAGLLTLLTVVLCFGLQSAIDWTWYVPAVTVPALICAGWVAGRGPLNDPIGRRPRRRRLLDHAPLPITLTSIVVIALALDWAIWQPLRSTQSDNAASATVQHDPSAAFADARAALAEDPLSLQPRSVLADLDQGAGKLTAARGELVQETRIQPENYLSWSNLGSFDLDRHNYRIAFKELTVAHIDNQSDPTATLEFGEAGDAVSRETAAAVGAAKAKAAR
jgi:hypothetical protein